MASHILALFFVALTSGVAGVVAQDCVGCISPTVTCTNAVKIRNNPPTFYLPCLAGQPITSLQQAAGCAASYPDLPFDPTPVPAPSGGRKLSMTSPVRSLLQGDLCSTVPLDGGAVCPASHNGLGSASISFPRIGLGQSSSNCPPLDINFVLAGSCEVGGLSARSRVTSCATTSITAAPASGVISAEDFGCVAVNDFSAAGVNAAQSWYFQDVISGRNLLAWTPFLNTRSCAYKVAAFASNSCKALSNGNTFTVTVGNGPLVTGALAASCPKPYAV